MPTVSPDVARSGMVRQGCTGCSAPRTMTRPMSTSRPASRDLGPGQGTQLGVQGGLVALDDEQVPAPVAVQVPGVDALGV
jgi:hypothetical protein